MYSKMATICADVTYFGKLIGHLRIPHFVLLKIKYCTLITLAESTVGRNDGIVKRTANRNKDKNNRKGKRKEK